jgi:hypothetical protein
MKTNLVGYVRVSRDGETVVMNISVKQFLQAERYTSRDGEEYVSLRAGADRIKKVMGGEKELTALIQVLEGED